MSLWTVWENDHLDEPLAGEQARFVRDGWSLSAMLVPPLWLIANGLWLVLIGYLAASALVWTVLSALHSTDVASVGVVALAVWFGLEARALKRWSLSRRGWTLKAVVDARDLAGAERRYFDERQARIAPLAPPAMADVPPGAEARESALAAALRTGDVTGTAAP